MLLGYTGAGNASPQIDVSQVLLSRLQAPVFRLVKVVNMSDTRHSSY